VLKSTANNNNNNNINDDGDGGKSIYFFLKTYLSADSVCAKTDGHNYKLHTVIILVIDLFMQTIS
jgi:hypothetical protein